MWPLLLSAVLSLGPAWGAPGSDGGGSARAALLSPVYRVRRKYRSMEGPSSAQSLRLGGARRLLWITGYSAVVTDKSGEREMPREFMCHSNLDLDPGAHRKAFASARTPSSRLFTLSQGQQALRFPAGFGIPVYSDEELKLTTQVLNLNEPKPRLKLRMRVDVEYAEDAGEPMQPLFQLSAYGVRPLADGHAAWGQVALGDKKAAAGGDCAPAEAVSHELKDPLGRPFTGHWSVPPGRQVYSMPLTRMMGVPYDTTVHYVLTHLHPYAESLELRDLTDGRSLFKAEAENYRDRAGLDRVSEYSSAEGFPIFRDHEYELVSVYDNTSGKDQDAMAVMYLFLRDKEFAARDPGASSRAPGSL